MVLFARCVVLRLNLASDAFSLGGSNDIARSMGTKNGIHPIANDKVDAKKRLRVSKTASCIECTLGSHKRSAKSNLATKQPSKQLPSSEPAG